MRSSLAMSARTRTAATTSAGSAVALSLAPAGQTQFGMGAPGPMDQKHNFGHFSVDISNDLVDHRIVADAFLQPDVGHRCAPDGFEIVGDAVKVEPDLSAPASPRRCAAIFLASTSATRASVLFQRVSSSLRHEPVLGIGGVILPECPISLVTGSLEIALQRVADLIAPVRGFEASAAAEAAIAAGSTMRSKAFFNGIVDAQAPEGDTARLALIEQAAMTGVAWNVVLGVPE